MKKLISAVLIFAMTGMGHANPVALVYQNEEDVKAGKYDLGTVTSQGIVISVEKALSANGTPMVSSGKGLHQGSILRLDNELNIAILKIGDPVQNEELANAHQQTMEKVVNFIPQDPASSEESDDVTFGSESMEGAKDDEPFKIRVNREELTGKAIELNIRKAKADMKLTIVRTNEEAIWKASVYLDADPHLRFWKKKKAKSLTAVPMRKLVYHYQSMFGKFAYGKSFTIPIEISSIKEEHYTFRVRIKTKTGDWIKKFPVRFVK